MKFIKIKNTIVNVAEIKLIYTHDQILTIECTDKVHRFNFGTENGARDELNRIYKQLE
jgi:hypothetical protein